MIKVLVVDDSALIRKILTEILSSDPNINVVGTASDPYLARDKIKQLNPDVLTLDVEMPRMDGITFLRNLMKLRPMPVVMVSTLTHNGGLVTLDALEIGAVDYIPKPCLEGEGLFAMREEICDKVKSAAAAKVAAFDPDRFVQKSVIQPIDRAVQLSDKIIAIGASTGGTEAIKDILMQLPGQMAPIVVTQHIPKAFSTSYAQRLDRSCQINVVEVADGMRVSMGYAYLAPGDQHLRFEYSGQNLVCRLSSAPPVNRHRPSVEVMFDSLRQVFKGRIVSVMLTGMGADGAQAMLRLKQAGHTCLVQDEASCVVYGMPKVAFELGVTNVTTALRKMPEVILTELRKKV
ncbi:MAG: chemotaxis response regulator protein-glutamate methylesterase [Reinekea sp.]|jgi:two-component system, chemotaxis family, protein-glutamate methylesterase/glutaminase